MGILIFVNLEIGCMICDLDNEAHKDCSNLTECVVDYKKLFFLLELSA